MTIDGLKQNLEQEKELLKELFIFHSQLNNLEKLYPHEKRKLERDLLVKAINSSFEKLRILNNSIPLLIEAVPIFKSLETFKPETKKAESLIKISYPNGRERVSVTIESREKENFLKELNLSKDTLRRLAKGVEPEKREFIEFRKAGFYAKISNKIFFNISNSLIEKKHFKKLNTNLRKANMPYLLSTYVSMAFFSSLIALILGIFLFLFFMFFNLTSNYPFIEPYMPNIAEILRNLFVIIALPLATFASFYFYPYAERKSIESKINQELPFVALHMSAIAGSGIEPSQIFKIIALGREYPNSREEMKKIINQVNVYGYDLITALKNTARETSSKKLSELLNGISTTISGGGSLNEFLDKRAETLLFEYKLERERYTKSAETFMDIYISIVIAAPMILTLLLVLMSVSGISIGLSPGILSIIIIFIIALINFIFLIYLHLSQPSY